ncbi:MAG: hypothetical protein KC589_03955 [Nanoarchaeota archaeon]|nr:hypothetical protein [Nanoarchaeota archaeon]
MLKNRRNFSFFRKNKKGFGDAASSLILFIAVIIVTTAVIILFKNFVSETQGSFAVQSDVVNNKLKTIISVSNVYYNSSSNLTYVYVKNLGETKLRPLNFDLFIDEAFQSGFSVKYASNLSKDLTLLNPQETCVLIQDRYLTPGSHELLVVTEYSSSAEDSFNT